MCKTLFCPTFGVQFISKNNLAGKVINFKRTVYMKQYNQSFVPYFTIIETGKQFIRAEIRQ
jgi:hypothetical protein